MARRCQIPLVVATLGLALASPCGAAVGDLTQKPAPDGCLAFRRAAGAACLVNLSGAPVPLPEGRVLLASADVGGGVLPDDAAVWLHA